MFSSCFQNTLLGIIAVVTDYLNNWQSCGKCEFKCVFHLIWIVKELYACTVEAQWLVEPQWLSDRMPDSRSREHRHESPTHWRR